MNPLNANDAIGVFDSGVGGLSVVQHILELLPNETINYVADSAYAPYGLKEASFIRARAEKICEFLISQNVKAIVVACNTATAAAIQELRARFTIPIIGMEPAVKPAAIHTDSCVIGILATESTLCSHQFDSLIKRFGSHVKVVSQAGHGLVELIEKGQRDSAETQQLLANYLHPMLEQGADILVLGCTHYPFLKTPITAIVDGKMKIIDTGFAVARHLRNRLTELKLLANTVVPNPAIKIWTSGDPAGQRQVIEAIFPAAVEINSLPEQWLK